LGNGRENDGKLTGFPGVFLEGDVEDCLGNLPDILNNTFPQPFLIFQAHHHQSFQIILENSNQNLGQK
jgi:hypothetical protein